jgi:hypothetical protein
MNVFRPALIRPLPIPLPPFPGECESSYWSRLALANHVPMARLRAPSRWLESRLTSVDVLCILSSQTRQHLVRTLPDLQTDDRLADPPDIPDDHVLRWACRRCVVARTGSTLPAQIWAPIHDNVCTRHKLWVGQHVHAPEEQLDLSRTPDVVRAQHKYWRLRRHHGPALIDLCEELTAGLWSGLSHRHYRLVHRAETLHDLVRVKGPDVEPDRRAPWLTAAGFPERVALIHMFTSPRWRKLAMSDDFYVSLSSIAQFHQRFPTQSPIRGTSRIWLTKTVKSTAAEIEYRLGNPDGTATLIAARTPISA